MGDLNFPNFWGSQAQIKAVHIERPLWYDFEFCSGMSYSRKINFKNVDNYLLGPVYDPYNLKKCQMG